MAAPTAALDQADVRALVPVDRMSIYPSDEEARFQLNAIARFQLLVRQTFKRDLDFGVIPGTQKPTLYKPGADKVRGLLGCSDQYSIVDSVVDWDRPLFSFTYCCRLVHIQTGLIIGEGAGECNSMESKYRYRWCWPNEVEEEVRRYLEGKRGYTKTIHTKNGDRLQYRVDNDDVYSLKNTILKMAKKRALVDVALGTGRLGEIFTQDLEDMEEFLGRGVVIEHEPASAPTAPQPASQQRSAPARQAPAGEAVDQITDESDLDWRYWVLLQPLCADNGVKTPTNLKTLPASRPAVKAATDAAIRGLQMREIPIPLRPADGAPATEPEAPEPEQEQEPQTAPAEGGNGGQNEIPF